MHKPNQKFQDKPRSEYEEHVLQVDRVSRTVKGGKRMRFRALVIIGNRAGKVGIGVGKASEVVDAVAKATTFAKKHILEIPIVNESIPFPIEVSQGAAHIILKPAKPGTSIIAGGTIRVICNLVGIKNLVAKILGTANKINNAQTTMLALETLAKQWKESPEGQKEKEKKEKAEQIQAEVKAEEVKAKLEVKEQNGVK